MAHIVTVDILVDPDSGDEPEDMRASMQAEAALEAAVETGLIDAFNIVFIREADGS